MINMMLLETVVATTETSVQPGLITGKLFSVSNTHGS